MRIISSKTLRNDYSNIVAEAHATGEPFYITRNGAQDVVLMSQEAFEEREAMLNERAAVLEAEAEYRKNGTSYSFDEVRSMLQAARDKAAVA